MNELLKKIFGDKKTWRRMEARAKALPKDYDFVYHKIQQYMWNFASGTGMDQIAIFEDLLRLFEESAADGKHVLDITGEDVAAFCDELLRNARTYTENWRESLNNDIRKRLGHRSDSGLKEK